MLEDFNANPVFNDFVHNSNSKEGKQAAKHYELAINSQTSINNSLLHLNASIVILSHDLANNALPLAQAYLKRAAIWEEKNDLLKAHTDYSHCLQLIYKADTCKIINIKNNQGFNNSEIFKITAFVISEAALAMAEIQFYSIKSNNAPNEIFKYKCHELCDIAINYLNKLPLENSEIIYRLYQAYQTTGLILIESNVSLAKFNFQKNLKLSHYLDLPDICYSIVDTYKCLNIIAQGSWKKTSQQSSVVYNLLSDLFLIISEYIYSPETFNIANSPCHEQQIYNLNNLLINNHNALNKSCLHNYIDALILIFSYIQDGIIPEILIFAEDNQHNITSFLQQIQQLLLVNNNLQQNKYALISNDKHINYQELINNYWQRKKCKIYRINR